MEWLGAGLREIGIDVFQQRLLCAQWILQIVDRRACLLGDSNQTCLKLRMFGPIFCFYAAKSQEQVARIVVTFEQWIGFDKSERDGDKVVRSYSLPDKHSAVPGSQFV
jgi:hypothetical protein